MINFFKNIANSFLGADGLVSHNKVYAFFGFFSFLIVSAIVLYTAPDKFNYDLFVCAAAGSATSIKILDKYLNVINNRDCKKGNTDND